ncbi:male-enhanced antigen 1 [Battus philenor]|uniref:male-enhanced antigen 1 n=1 Tax=Battus philenor TaxID=42288 RepID=UPI0035D0342E
MVKEIEMVCDGPDPPENSPNSLTPPPRHNLLNGNHNEESDDEIEYFGYQPLPQGPNGSVMDLNESDDDVENSDEQQAPTQDVPAIEPIENALVREVWSAPRTSDPIQMDNERVQQVMSAMANFALPETSIPEWAQSISEDQWKQTLNDRLELLRNNR